MDSSMSLSRQNALTDDALSRDELLAREIAAGDTNAWARFFDRYFTWTYRFAYRHLNSNRADAEDLCSDILMTAARSIRQYNSTRGALDVWLLGIARHRLARFCRNRRMEVPTLPEFRNDVENPEIALNLFSTDSMLMRDTVNRALASLPERQAAVLIGKYIEGYSVEEIARAEKTTPKTIESLLTRARVAFRTAFKALTNLDNEK